MSAETPVKEDEKIAPTPESSSSDEPRLPQPRPEELPAVLEALLFAATAPLSIKRLSLLTSEVPPETIEAALEGLRARYEDPASGLMLMEVAGGYQLATRPSVADWVLALHKHRRKNPISPAVLETLAIVAYKQPLVRAEVESIRGVDCGGVMRSLQDAGLVEVVGQKEVPGRPSLYGTTDTFLKTFGLRNLNELPSLTDLKKILTTQMKGKEDEEVAPTEETTTSAETAETSEPETADVAVEPIEKAASDEEATPADTEVAKEEDEKES